MKYYVVFFYRFSTDTKPEPGAPRSYLMGELPVVIASWLDKCPSGRCEVHFSDRPTYKRLCWVLSSGSPALPAFAGVTLAS